MSSFVSKSFGPPTFAFALDGVVWIGRHVFGYPFVPVDFLDSLTTLEDKPVCHIYQWVAHPIPPMGIRSRIWFFIVPVPWRRMKSWPMLVDQTPSIRSGIIGPYAWPLGSIPFSGPMVPILSLIWTFWRLFRNPLFLTSSHPMDQTFAYGIISYQYSHSDSTIHFFLGLLSTLN